MSAHEVIADTIGESELIDSNELTRRIVALRVLDALTAAGYAVVKLPEPIEVGEFGTQFSDGSTVGTLTAGDNMVYHGGWEWSSDQCREVAAQWLAAADCAEKISVHGIPLMRDGKPEVK